MEITPDQVWENIWVLPSTPEMISTEAKARLGF